MFGVPRSPALLGSQATDTISINIKANTEIEIERQY